MTKEELEKYTVDFMNNETGSKYSNINSVLGKMLIKYAEVFQKRIAELEKRCSNYEMKISKMEKGTCDVCKETEKDKQIAELEKEATEYAQKLGAKDFIAKPKEIVAYFAYLTGAEPREKQIEIDAEQIRALQKQNGELTDMVKELEAVRPQWHDLRKDPNDLPEKYIPVNNQDGEHRFYDGHYWRDCDDVIYTNVIAWCEIPTFDKEIKENDR